MTAFLDEETLTLIQETAVRADGAAGKVQVLALPGEPPHVYATVGPDGVLQKHTVTPPFRNHMLRSVSEVPGFVASAKERFDSKPSIWYSPIAVIVLLDDSPDLNKLGAGRVQLVHTPQFAAVLKLQTTRFNQKDFVRLLRTTLLGCLDDDGRQLLRVARVIDFAVNTTGRGTVERSRESIGREIEAEVRSDAGEFPEGVVLSVRVFTDPALTVTRRVSCAVEIDAKDQTFELVPLPLQCEEAIQADMDQLRGMLEAGTSDVPIFYGNP